jgi:hypothetical protein
MDKSTFTTLPLALALAALYDAVPALASAPTVQAPQSPKFDQRIRVKNGYCYASECSVDQLQYHIGRAAGSDARYEERDAKLRKSLGFFVTWRSANPSECWRGERFHELVTAKPPSSRPDVHEWEPKAPVAAIDLDEPDTSDLPF